MVSIAVLAAVQAQVPAAEAVPVSPVSGVVAGVPLFLMVRFVEAVKLALPQDESAHLRFVLVVRNVAAERVSDEKEQLKEIPTYNRRSVCV